MSDLVEVRVTCPDTEVARDIASAALAARLVACANIMPGVLSLYWWDAEIAEDDEVFLSLKAREETLAALVALITAEHPYETPVIEWMTVGTTPEALAWLVAETGG